MVFSLVSASKSESFGKEGRGAIGCCMLGGVLERVELRV